MTPPRALIWLRRDLRLNDNLAIHHAIESGANIAVLYVLDDAILASRRMGAARVKFMTEALTDLDRQLRDYGSRLIVRRGNPSEVVLTVAQQLKVSAVYFNLDYSPYARKRDAAVIDVLDEQGIASHTYHDRVLVPPDALLNGVSKPYTVYTAYRNKWRETTKPFPNPVNTELRGAFFEAREVEMLPVPTSTDLGFPSAIDTPLASIDAARNQLQTFLYKKIFDYTEGRDALANPFTDPRNGTSSMSPYIRWGLISPRQLRQAAAAAYEIAPNEASREGVNSWVDELIWAEFYTQILWHFPHVKTRNFKPEYDAVQWRDAPDELAAWQAGQTGYPVVDAAMRQLNATGWMHNRARMIVASFLTKDLLIDWREGELYFMQKLLDGDLAANNGGWQWSASTGTDAQPYFRIFNPTQQGEKFDPEAIFIQKWVPELRGWSVKYIHAPWTMNNAPDHYPHRMIDHSFARERTLAAFKVTKPQK